MDVTYADGYNFLIPMYGGIGIEFVKSKDTLIEPATKIILEHGTTSSVGANNPRKNRPSYYVVAYIIYIEN